MSFEGRLRLLLEQHAIQLPSRLFSHVLSYISLLPTEETWKEVGDYFSEIPSIDEVTECFETDLQFGTAGLRAKMGVGNARMNVVTVGKAASGLSSYLPANSRILLGYDHRHNSRAFAEVSVRVFEAAGHVVEVFPEPCPTPLVANGLRMREEEGYYALGIMITASHNPRPDNGYKVYNARGAQILDADASLIAGHISKVELIQLSEKSVVFDDQELLDSVFDWYQGQLRGWLGSYKIAKTFTGKARKIVYTPMHGVGGKFVEILIKNLFSAELIPVKEQFKPNPDFPTVEYPNPEEGLSALQLAIETAEAQGADYIFANDPDADRFLVAQRNENGWKVFSGNEMAAIFAHFIAENHEMAISEPGRVAMLSSCVSSRFLKRLCAMKGFVHESTATGFKNLGNRAWQLRKERHLCPLFSFEEAIGFAVGFWSLDKDGMSALVAMFEILRRQSDGGDGLVGYLQSIYDIYGVKPVQCNGYILVPQPAQTIQRMLNERIPKLTEHFKGVEVVEATAKASEFNLPRGGWLMIRASGTEPKVKYYSEQLLIESSYSEQLQTSKQLQTNEQLQTSEQLFSQFSTSKKFNSLVKEIVNFLLE